MVYCIQPDDLESLCRGCMGTAAWITFHDEKVDGQDILPAVPIPGTMEGKHIRTAPRGPQGFSLARFRVAAQPSATSSRTSSTPPQRQASHGIPFSAARPPPSPIRRQRFNIGNLGEVAVLEAGTTLRSCTPDVGVATLASPAHIPARPCVPTIDTQAYPSQRAMVQRRPEGCAPAVQTSSPSLQVHVPCTTRGRRPT